jgi:hypothetical protein
MGSSKTVVQHERCAFSAEFKAEAVRLLPAMVGASVTSVPPAPLPAVKYAIASGPEAASAVVPKALKDTEPVPALAVLAVRENPVLLTTRRESNVRRLALHARAPCSAARVVVPAALRSTRRGTASRAPGAT